MPEDKVIKSGQFTLPRLLFLGAAGLLIVFFVARGGAWLTVGYFSMTLALCVLLFLIAIDYGVTLDKVTAQGQPASGPAPALDLSAPSEVFKPTASEPRPKRKGSRPAKRRR
jgi:hypothetical protein